MLAQKLGEWPRPVAYYSTQLYPIIQGSGKSRKDLLYIPLKEPELELHVDGSSFYIKGQKATDYVVTTHQEVLLAAPLNLKLSAQASELVTRTETCTSSREDSEHLY